MSVNFRVVRLFLVVYLVLHTACADAQRTDTGKKKHPNSPSRSKPGLTISRHTTWFTAPLTQSGYVDYPGAINTRLGRGITSENNANVLFWQALGPEPNEKKMPPRFFSLMGMDEPPDQGDNFLDLSQYLQQVVRIPRKDPAYLQIINEQGLAAARPWKTGQYPQIRAWLKANEKPLSLVVAGTKRPKYFSPLVIPDGVTGADATLVNMLLPAVQQARSFARALSARAMWHTGEGRDSEAWQDLLACHRLGRLIGQGSTTIEALIGIAIDSVASQSDLAFIESSGPGAKQTRIYLNDLEALPPLPDMAEKINVGERCFFLDIVQMLVREGSAEGLEQIFGTDDKVGGLSSRLAGSTIDWNTTMRFGNGWYDRLVEVTQTKNYQDRKQALERIDQDLKKLADEIKGGRKSINLLPGNSEAGEKVVGKVLLAMVLPAVTQVRIAEDRAMQNVASLRIAFALAGYQSVHGRYPETLNQLSPEFLKQVPDDLFAGNPLNYRRTEDGYLLYSIGTNAEDEGGRGARDDRPGDDLSIRMPLPSTEE